MVATEKRPGARRHRSHGRRARRLRAHPDARGAGLRGRSGTAHSARAARAAGRARERRQARLDAGELPDFLPETADIRRGDWRSRRFPPTCGPPRRDHRAGRPQDGHQRAELRRERLHGRLRGLERRRPGTTLEGQVESARRGAPARSTSRSPEGKQYKLNETTATLMVRPRGWHLTKSTCSWTASRSRRRCSISACSSSTTPQTLIDKGTGPYFYLPKMESHLEARLWNDVFIFAQDELGIPRGTIRATVLIETILAAFEMDEILYELRDHSAGLNCGRWDYIFSFIKKFRNRPEFMLPDRAQVTMTAHVHALVFAAADQDLPSPRHPRDGRHGRADSDQERSGGQRAGAGEGARRQGARSRRRPRRHLGGASRPGAASRRKSSTPTCPARTRSTGDATTCTSRPRICWKCPTGDDHAKTACGPTCAWAFSTWRLAARQRLRADLQPDGRRRHGRNLARATLAVDSSPARLLRRRPQDHGASWSSRCWPTSWTSCTKAWAPRPSPAASSNEAGELFWRSATADEFAEFMTLAAYEHLD